MTVHYIIDENCSQLRVVLYPVAIRAPTKVGIYRGNAAPTKAGIYRGKVVPTKVGIYRGSAAPTKVGAGGQ